MRFSYLLWIATAITLCFISCEKKEIIPTEKEPIIMNEALDALKISKKQMVTENAILKTTLSVLVDIAGFQFAGSGSADTRNNCPNTTFTTNPSTGAFTHIQDFGTGCTDAFGNEWKGKVTTTSDGPLGVVGTNVTITMDDLFGINNLDMDGFKHLQFSETKMIGADKHEVYSIVNKLITTTDGGFQQIISTGDEANIQGECLPGAFIYVDGGNDNFVGGTFNQAGLANDRMIKEECMLWNVNNEILLEVKKTVPVLISHGICGSFCAYDGEVTSTSATGVFGILNFAFPATPGNAVLPFDCNDEVLVTDVVNGTSSVENCPH